MAASATTTGGTTTDPSTLDALVAPVSSVVPATTVIRLLNGVDDSDRTWRPWVREVAPAVGEIAGHK